jgi:DNA-binding response OmpR family regulator
MVDDTLEDTLMETARILVVDDNEMNRDMLARRLKRQGYEVDLAEDGDVALETIRTSNYDLILLDIMMPRMNGYEVLEELKNDQAYQDIPIIMISAVDDLDSIVRCIELGAEDYLFKPFNPVLLRARIKSSIERQRQRSEGGLQVELVKTKINTLRQSVQELDSSGLNPQQSSITSMIASQLDELLADL